MSGMKHLLFTYAKAQAKCTIGGAIFGSVGGCVVSATSEATRFEYSNDTLGVASGTIKAGFKGLFFGATMGAVAATPPLWAGVIGADYLSKQKAKR